MSVQSRRITRQIKANQIKANPNKKRGKAGQNKTKKFRNKLRNLEALKLLSTFPKTFEPSGQRTVNRVRTLTELFSDRASEI